jgi:hypothetical protein
VFSEAVHHACPEDNTMVMVKVNARDQIVQVAESDGTTWTEIANLNTIGFDRSANEETADTTTMDSDGAYEQEIMQRGAAFTLEGFQTKDRTTGAKDPGQARCETLADAIGYDSLGKLRFRHVMDTTWTIWNATFSVGEQGGGTNDKSSWSCNVTRSGPATTAAVS